MSDKIDNDPGHLLLPHLWHRSFSRDVDHRAVLARVQAECGWSLRYVFLTLMAAGVAVLGLLLSSPAVVIGAMLISPLMNPILGLGFSLALFDYEMMRRSLIALVLGSLAAMIFSTLIVLASPLKELTAEILSRTRPDLFDMLIALFAALAGTFASIKLRAGAEIVGVAIATALMPPLGVIGYGLAIGNLDIARGAAMLFVTNFVTIALAATIMARIFGFGHFLSSKQTLMQTAALVIAFVVLAVPLATSLGRIAHEARLTNHIRSFLNKRFGPGTRITQLNIDFDAKPILVQSLVITPRQEAIGDNELHADLVRQLGQPVSVQVDQVLLEPGIKLLDAQRKEFNKTNELNTASVTQATAAATEAAKQATEAKAALAKVIAGEAILKADSEAKSVAKIVAVAAGVSPDMVTLDRDHRRATALAAITAGEDAAYYQQQEQHAAAAAEGWNVVIVPPFAPFPLIHFTKGKDTLDSAAQAAIMLSAWEAHRWNIPALGVPGLPANGAVTPHPTLAQRRALAIAAILAQQDLKSLPARGAAISFRLVAASAQGSPP